MLLLMVGCGNPHTIGLAAAPPKDGELAPASGQQFISARFSPDGLQIAFHALVGGSRDIVGVMASDGTGAHELATSRSALTSVVWAPDGKLVYFSSDLGIEEVDPAGGVPTHVTDATAATQLDVSADGAALLWVKDGSTLQSLQRNKPGATAQGEAHRGTFPRFDENGAVPGYVYVGVSGTGRPLQRDILGTAGPSGNVTMDLGPLASVSVLGKDEYVVTSQAGIERVTQAGVRTMLHARASTTRVDATADAKWLLYFVDGKDSLFVIPGI